MLGLQTATGTGMLVADLVNGFRSLCQSRTLPRKSIQLDRLIVKVQKVEQFLD